MNVVTSLTLYNAKEAIDYYQDIFDAELKGEIIYMENMPGYEETSHKGLIAHSQIKIGETNLFVNDQLDDHIQEVGRNIQFCIFVDSYEKLEELFKKLSYEATLEREIEDEYWGAKSFSVRDKFDIVWHIFYILEEQK